MTENQINKLVDAIVSKESYQKAFEQKDTVSQEMLMKMIDDWIDELQQPSCITEKGKLDICIHCGGKRNPISGDIEHDESCF